MRADIKPETSAVACGRQGELDLDHRARQGTSHESAHDSENVDGTDATASHVGTWASGILRKTISFVVAPDEEFPEDFAKDIQAKLSEPVLIQVGRLGSIAMPVRTGPFKETRQIVSKIIRSQGFGMFVALIILVNSVTIGLSITWDLEGKNTFPLEIAESCFLGIYTIELMLRFFAYGYTCLKDNWVKFDAFLVALGILDSWVLKAFQVELGPLLVLRALRLSRLARMFRLLVKFQTLWMLVRGLLNSAEMMLHTLFLLTFILYIFSAMGIELITHHSLAEGPDPDPEFSDIVGTYFADLPSTMVTLMQFTSLDSIAAIYRPLVMKDFKLIIYFISIILIVPIVVLNLVTAIIVNSALEQANMDKEAAALQKESAKKKLLDKLRVMFLSLDADNSGYISRGELQMASEDERNALLDVSPEDPLDLFDALDVDQTDNLSIDEFCEGLWAVSISKETLETQRMIKQVAKMFVRLKSMEAIQDKMERNLSRLIKGQERSHIEISNVRTEVRASRRLNSQKTAFSHTGEESPSSVAPEHRIIVCHSDDHLGLASTITSQIGSERSNAELIEGMWLPIDPCGETVAGAISPRSDPSHSRSTPSSLGVRLDRVLRKAGTVGAMPIATPDGAMASTLSGERHAGPTLDLAGHLQVGVAVAPPCATQQEQPQQRRHAPLQQQSTATLANGDGGASNGHVVFSPPLLELKCLAQPPPRLLRSHGELHTERTALRAIAGAPVHNALATLPEHWPESFKEDRVDVSCSAPPPGPAAISVSVPPDDRTVQQQHQHQQHQRHLPSPPPAVQQGSLWRGPQQVDDFKPAPRAFGPPRSSRPHRFLSHRADLAHRRPQG